MDYIEWGNIHGESNRQSFDAIPEANLLDENAYHVFYCLNQGSGCKCDSDSALKIQYLRFIYTFCCRDSKNITNKLQLISEKDKENSFLQSYILAFYLYFQYNITSFKGKDVVYNKNYMNVKESFAKVDFLEKNDEINKVLNDILLNQLR